MKITLIKILLCATALLGVVMVRHGLFALTRSLGFAVIFIAGYCLGYIDR